MIYRILKRIVKIALYIFFKKIVVNGKENIPAGGPLIIVANHPNTLIDPLLIAAMTKQRVGFVANASIFINKLATEIFRYFHVIPVYRKKDVQPGEKPDNKAAFVKCHEYLDNGGTLLIFPEGESLHELKLREIKTGTARIALSYEEQKSFESNLKILPVALDYSDSLQFRSMVALSVNPPLSTQAYKSSYTTDDFSAVNELTEDIRKALAVNIPLTSGKEQEGFLINSHRFYTTFVEPDTDLYQNPKRSLELRTQLAKVIHYIQKNNFGLYQRTQTNVNIFYDKLKSEGITAGFFTDRFLEKNGLLVLSGYFLIFILLLPLYLTGLLFNFIPYILPSKIFQAIKIDIEYKTSVALVTGLLLFPVFYGLTIWLFRVYISAVFWHSLLLLVVLPLSGYVAMYYWTEFKRFIRVINFYFFLKPEVKTEMIGLRNEILNNMEEARKSLG